MKRHELALKLNLTPVQLDTLLSNFPEVDPVSEDVPQSVVDVILSKTKRIQQAPVVATSDGTAKASLSNLEQLIQGYRDNSVDYIRGLEQQSLREEAFLGDLLGKQRALTRLEKENDAYEEILTEVSLARSESALTAIELYLARMAKASSQTQERIEKANELLGKFDNLTGLE